MKVMASLTFTTALNPEIIALIPAEDARIKELKAEGKLDAMYLSQASGRAWLVFNVESEDEARRLTETLPLHPYVSVDLATLAGPM